jgi:hypothetical protein
MKLSTNYLESWVIAHMIFILFYYIYTFAFRFIVASFYLVLKNTLAKPTYSLFYIKKILSDSQRGESNRLFNIFFGIYWHK